MAQSVKLNLPCGESIQINTEPTANHTTDVPNVTAGATPPAGKAVSVVISGTDKVRVRFSNPS